MDLYSGLNGSENMEWVALFSWIEWLCHLGILKPTNKGYISLLLKLSDTYGKTRIKNACQLALNHISQPGYKNIKTILQSNQDLKK